MRSLQSACTSPSQLDLRVARLAEGLCTLPARRAVGTEQLRAGRAGSSCCSSVALRKALADGVNLQSLSPCFLGTCIIRYGPCCPLQEWTNTPLIGGGGGLVQRTLGWGSAGVSRQQHRFISPTRRREGGRIVPGTMCL